MPEKIEAVLRHAPLRVGSPAANDADNNEE